MIDLKSAYDNNQLKYAYSCEVGAVGLLKELINILTILKQLTDEELKAVEYAPKVYDQLFAILTSAIDYAEIILNLQTTHYTMWYQTWGLTTQMVSNSIKQFELKTDEIFISNKTKEHWKVVAVLLEAIAQLYVPPEASYNSLTDSFSQRQAETTLRNMETHVPPLQDVAGVSGKTFAAGCDIVAGKIRRKIVSYELEQPQRYNAAGIPLSSLDTVPATRDYSKLVVLESLMSGDFSREQLERVYPVRKRAIAAFKGYLASRWSRLYTSPPNTDIVQNALTFFEKNLDPKTLLQKLIELEGVLTERRSTTMLPAVQTIIASAFDALRVTVNEQARSSPGMRLSASSNAS